MGFETALQSSIYTVLSAGLSVSVFDCPQKEPAYPYVVIGDDSFIPFDTDTTIGRDVVASVHVWDNYNGRKRIKAVMGEIDALLNRANFSVTGYHLINCVFDSSDQFLEPDGKTYHGVLTYRILLDEV